MNTILYILRLNAHESFCQRAGKFIKVHAVASNAAKLISRDLESFVFYIRSTSFVLNRFFCYGGCASSGKFPMRGNNTRAVLLLIVASFILQSKNLGGWWFQLNCTSLKADPISEAMY